MDEYKPLTEAEKLLLREGHTLVKPFKGELHAADMDAGIPRVEDYVKQLKSQQQELKQQMDAFAARLGVKPNEGNAGGIRLSFGDGTWYDLIVLGNALLDRLDRLDKR